MPLLLLWALGTWLQVATAAVGVPEVVAAASGFTEDGGAAVAGAAAQQLLQLQVAATAGGVYFTVGVFQYAVRSSAFRP